MAKLFLCLAIAFIACCYFCAVTEAEVPVDCCLSVKNKTLHQSLVANYRLQVAGEGCSLPAAVLVTRKGRELCFPPEEPWVQNVIQHVKKLREHCKENGYKGRRCIGVHPE